MLAVCPPPQFVKVDGSLYLDQEFRLEWVDLEEFLSSRETFPNYSDGTLVCLIVYALPLTHNQVPKKEVLVPCRTNWTECLYKIGPI